ncbi:MAG: septation protein A [Burkholderiaceae bacterium]
MKLLFDLFPVLLFFAAFKLYDIYVATGVAIAASVLQIVWLLMRKRKVEAMQWLSLGIIVLFGGMTLVFHNETFIKWKPTVLYLAFAGGLFLAKWLRGKNLIASLMGKQLTLPQVRWDQLNIAWMTFFGLMAGLNLLIAYNFSTELWVQFKVFGTLALTLLFVLAQGLWMSRYMEEPVEESAK